MENKRIVSKSILYFIGNFSSKILSTILVPIYAFYVKSEDFGNYDLAQTMMNIIIPIVFVAIWDSILRFGLSSDKGKTEKTISSSFIFVIIMSIIFWISAIIIFYHLSIVREEYFLMVLMIFSHGLTQIWQYYCRALKENTTYVVAGILGTVINFLATILLICIMRVGVYGLYISYIVGQISIVIFLEYKIRIRKLLTLKYFEIIFLKKMIVFSAPLVLNAISIWLIPLMMRLVVMKNLGNVTTGLYAFANKFNLIVNLIGTVVTMAVVEEAILTAKEEGVVSQFSRTVQQLFRIFQSLIIIAVPVVYIFYQFIRSTEYFSTAEYIPWFLAYAAIMNLSSNVGAIFQITDTTKYQFITTVIGGIFGVLVAGIFVQSVGIYAVLFGQLLGAAIILILRYLIAKHISGFQISWLSVLLDGLIFLLFAFICKKDSIILIILMVVAASAYVYLRNKKMFNSGIKILRNRLIK